MKASHILRVEPKQVDAWCRNKDTKDSKEFASNVDDLRSELKQRILVLIQCAEHFKKTKAYNQTMKIRTEVYGKLITWIETGCKEELKDEALRHLFFVFQARYSRFGPIDIKWPVDKQLQSIADSAVAEIDTRDLRLPEFRGSKS